MKWIIFLIPLIGLSQTKLNYEIFYSPNLEKEGLKVTIEFKYQKAQDSTSLYLVDKAWGENDLYRCIQILPEDNPEFEFKMIPEKHQLLFYHPQTKSVKISYRIKQDYDDEKDYHTVNRPRINNHYFSILGHSLLAVPYELTQKKESPVLNIQLTWKNFPADFVLHNSFGTQSKSQKIKAKLWEELYYTHFVGGDFRISKFEIKTKPVYLAVRGKWLNGYSDSFLKENLEKSLKVQREFWKDFDFDYYSVTMLPTVSQTDSLSRSISFTGSGLKNGFMIQGTNNLYNNADVYKYLLYHEMMHNWIGQKIPNKFEEFHYWFSEGFTDYYTYKNRLRSGDIDFDEWIKLYNEEVIKKHWENPMRNIPNYRIKDEFWTSRDVEKIPYRRGSIFAFWLDNQIMLKSNGTKSLDDLMRDLLQICTTENKFFSDELFIDLANDYLNENILYFFQKHILNGEDIDLINQKWIEGFGFESVAEVPVLKANKNIRYIF